MLLVFDGDCGFCTASARWIQRRLPHHVRVEPWQSLDLDGLHLTERDVTTAAWWVEASGVNHRGHAAIGRALIAAGGVWRIIGGLMVTPPVSWVARPAYWLIARNRHRLPGATESCRL